MIKIKFTFENPTKSLRSLFGHCQLRVFVSEKNYVDIGRFSSSAIDRLRMYKNIRSKGRLATIGDFCEFANAEILLGGEHANYQVVNQVFAGCPVFQTLIDKNGFNSQHQSKGEIKIGHGVIVSHGAKILSGVEVGQGSLIAAGALVVNNIPEFSVVGGVPAKIISKREVDQKASIHFWNMNLAQVFKFVTGKEMQDQEGQYSREDRLIIRMIPENDSEEGKFTGFEIMGVQTKNGFIQPTATSEFMRYCNQVSLKKGDTAEWLSNPFVLNMVS